MSRKVNPLFYVLIALAIFGLVTIIITKPGELLTRLLMTAGIVAIFFVVFYIIRNKSGASGFSSKYKKAVKQSKKKYGSNVHHTSQYARAARSPHKKKPDVRKKTRRNASHLRVIEGKKDKKKDRALY